MSHSRGKPRATAIQAGKRAFSTDVHLARLVTGRRLSGGGRTVTLRIRAQAPVLLEGVLDRQDSQRS